MAILWKWEYQQTVGLNYYGLPPVGRDRFKRKVRRHATLLHPILWLNGLSAKLDFRKTRIQYKGISAPTGSCSIEGFARAEELPESEQETRLDAFNEYVSNLLPFVKKLRGLQKPRLPWANPRRPIASKYSFL